MKLLFKYLMNFPTAWLGEYEGSVLSLPGTKKPSCCDITANMKQPLTLPPSGWYTYRPPGHPFQLSFVVIINLLGQET